jgi:GH35 family endo-1,4-beta-xylanase
MMMEGNLNSVVYIQKVIVVHNPDNHRPQTEQEKKDTLQYAINTWCDGLMKINEGRIKSFDLIDEAIDTKAELENGMYDLKHSPDNLYWQDVLGSEYYAPVISKAASDAFVNHGGNANELKFFISESGLENPKKMESLKYWINIWDQNQAKIDGINAKLNLTYSEDEAKQNETKASLDNLLDNLATTGKLIRLSNFDIKYQDATGANVLAKDITLDQRQRLADFYGYVIRSYMNKIPNDKQAGICKGNIADTSDPVGLWSVDKDSKDWVRTATYKAFCDALSGQ